jgi:hypothetical protein
MTLISVKISEINSSLKQKELPEERKKPALLYSLNKGTSVSNAFKSTKLSLSLSLD